MIVIGVGNTFRRDDGAGPAVIDRLRGAVPPEVRVAVCDGEPARLIELWTGVDLAVVIDAVRTGGPVPGRIHELDALTCARHAGARGAGGHDLGLSAAAALGAALGRMPRRLVVYAIEGANFGMGPGLSPSVERAVTEVAARVAVLTAAVAPP